MADVRRSILRRLGAAPHLASFSSPKRLTGKRYASTQPKEEVAATSANRSLEQAVNSATKPPSLARRVWDDGFANPANTFLNGIGLMYTGTKHGIRLFGEYHRDGKRVTKRSDIKHVQRVKKDLVRVLPAGVFVILPFSLPLLPLLFRIAPGFLPSCFVTDEVLNKKMKVLQASRTNMAPMLLSAFDESIESSVAKLAEREQQQAQAVVKRWKAIRGRTGQVADSEILGLHTLFRDHANFLTAPTRLTRIMQRFVGLSFPFVAPQARMLVWIDWVLKDDELLRQQGINTLTDYELKEALEERGFVDLYQRTSAELRGALIAHLRFTKQASDACLARARAAHMRSRSRQPAPTSLPYDDIISIASLVLVARAMRLHGA